MNKMYSDDILWYDPSVKTAIEELSEQYSNAIPVFGGALGAYNALEVGDYVKFEMMMLNAVDNAKFFRWHEPAITVARRFCRLCYVDPMLIEVHLGMGLDELLNL